LTLTAFFWSTTAFAAAAELDLRHFAEISTNGSSSSSSSSTSSTTNEASNDALQASSHSTDAEERKLAEVVVAPDDGTLDDFLKDVVSAARVFHRITTRLFQTTF
jgi:hypothetical protein